MMSVVNNQDGVAADPIVVESPKKSNMQTKLKQARLPFIQLGHTPHQVTASSKKRKLSDNEVPVSKLCKTNKTTKRKDDRICKKDGEIIDVSDNEVSSSCEMDTNISKASPPAMKTIKPGLLDRYIEAAQQREVSTSSLEEDTLMHDDKENDENIRKIISENDKLDRFLCNSTNITKDSLKSSGKNLDFVTKSKNDSNFGVETEVITLDNDDGDELKPADISSLSDLNNMSVLTDKEDDAIYLDDSINLKRNSEPDSCSTPVSKASKVDNSLSPSVPDTTTQSPAINKPAKKTPASRKKEFIETERQKKKEEKEKEKLEKLKQREEAKLEREKKKEEEKQRKEQERLMKEKEKQEKKEQLEKEKQEKQRLKEDERKKKQEALEEEKRKKEEEKKKKEEEKKQHQLGKGKDEDEKQKKLQQAFRKFFVKNETSPILKTTAKSSCNSFFRDFQVRENMRMAPSGRCNENTRAEKMKSLDELMPSQNASQLYIELLKPRSYRIGKSCKTWRLEPELLVTGGTAIAESVRRKSKYLKFRENHRPAYYGTWRKTSKVLTGRNPIKKDDDLFDYEVDSDDDWEEEDPGESLSHSEGEDEDDKVVGGSGGAVDDDEDDDGFLVPHGYLSGDEGCDEDEDVSPEKLKAAQLLKARQFEMELKRQCKALLPIIVGCFFQTSVGPLPEQFHQLQQYQALPIFDTTLPVATYHSRQGTCDELKSNSTNNPRKITTKKPVPEEAMSDLIKLVHGNTCGIKKIIREFREYWRQKNGCKPSQNVAEMSPLILNNSTGDDVMDVDHPAISVITPSASGVENSFNHLSDIDPSAFAISNRQLEFKIPAIADYKKDGRYHRKCWYVNSDILQNYDLNNLPIPNQWKYVTKQPLQRAPTPQQLDKDEKKDCAESKTTKSAGVSIKQFTVKSSPGDAFKTLSFLSPKLPVSVPKAPRRITLTSFMKPNCANVTNETNSKPVHEENTPVAMETECISVKSTGILLHQSLAAEDSDVIVLD